MRTARPIRLAAVFTFGALVLGACTASGEPSTAAAPPNPTSHGAHSVSASASESASVAAEPSATVEPSAEEEEQEEVEVRIEGDFDPAELTVAAGTTVAFVNADTYPHTVTEGSGGRAAEEPIVDSELAADEAARVTFTDPGTYELTCRFHPSMQMTITVEG